MYSLYCTDLWNDHVEMELETGFGHWADLALVAPGILAPHPSYLIQQ